MSKVELTLSTGHMATIEIEDDTKALLLSMMGKGEVPEHPDDRAKALGATLQASVDAGHLRVTAVHVVDYHEQERRFAAQYRNFANEMLEQTDGLENDDRDAETPTPDSGEEGVGVGRD